MLLARAAADFLVERGSGAGASCASTLAFFAGVLEVGVVDLDLTPEPLEAAGVGAAFLAWLSAHSLALLRCSSTDKGVGDAILPMLLLLFFAATGEGFVSFLFI